MNKEETEKKRKRIGWILTGSIHIVLIALLFAFSLPLPEKGPEPALVLDFTQGSSSQGGSSSAPTESETIKEEPEVKNDPVITQDKPSTVKKSTKPKSTSSSTSSKPAEKKPNSSALAGAGDFSGSGSGQSNGNGSGDNPGIGDGQNGPGPKGKFGNLGAGDGVAPRVSNPTKDQEGLVMMELTVDRKGKVIDVKILSNHPRTTTTDPVLLNQAKKDGFRFEFEADNRRAEFSKGTRGINYILQ